MAADVVTIKVCPVCGRTDRYTSIGSPYHSHGGERCAGSPQPAEFVPLARAEQSEAEVERLLRLLGGRAA